MASINQKTIYRTAQGKEIDLNKLINQNELTLAVGNKKVNARGDLIGPGGTIIKKQDDVMNGVHIPDQIRTQVEQPEKNTSEEIDEPKTKTKNVKNSDLED